MSRISICKSLLRTPFSKQSKPISSLLSNPYVSKSPISPPVSKFHTYIIPQTSSISRTHFRKFSGEPSFDQNKEIDEINLKFADAREEIELALESKETVYFDEEAETAREAVQVVLDKFDGLMAKLDEKEKGVLQRSMGLKMEQLKAELAQLNE
ncbi:hypothetical protein MKW94_022948 [Papaver nudicaule]|uniref:Late embryogenesis abundant protein n=1 Tax=Papaver nudicaule TaxID=74823 RepID=A0AA41VS13_PAPNU|nr:hypothetical protein [Papaver nudicaule]